MPSSREHGDTGSREDKANGGNAESESGARRIDEAAERWADNDRDLKNRGIERDCTRKFLGIDQKRHQRLGAWAGSAARRTEGHQHDVIGPVLPDSAEGDRKQNNSADRFDQKTCREHAPWIRAIDHDSGGQGEREHRHELTQSDEPQRQRIVGDVVDAPANPHRLHLHGDGAEEPAGQKQRNVRPAIKGGRFELHLGDRVVHIFPRLWPSPPAFKKELPTGTLAVPRACFMRCREPL